MKNTIIILLGLLVLSCSSEDNNQDQQLNFLEQYEGSVFFRETTTGITYIRFFNNENAPLDYHLLFKTLTPNDCFVNLPFDVSEPDAVVTKLESNLMEISRPMWVDTVLVRTYTVSNNVLSTENEWYANGELFLTNYNDPLSISSVNVDTLPLCSN
ncbi:hypothetical protein [Aestuariivivens sediminis]|uniref:hypothetical protein n=1 Tax=Aestuariivivens sediminis TaxID=2913557 RepID=UPI001F57D16C|nr:hypothetical protein [Aestuariivivens sediminis]